MGDAVFVLGKLAFAAIGIAVGGQLLAQTRRGDGIGLHTVALAAVGVAGLGLLAMPLAEALGSEQLSLAGEVAVRAALLLLCFFVAGTFRPDPAGLAAASACAVLLVATLLWDVVAQPSLLGYDYTRPSSHANQLAVAIPFTWSALESGAAWRRARRRERVGLGDPLLTEHFLVWSLATACFVGVCLLAVAAGLAAQAATARAAELAHGLRGVLYLAITGLVWRARFAGRAGRRSADAEAEPRGA